MKRIQGKPMTTLREIFSELRTQTGRPVDQFQKEFQNFAAHFEHFLLFGNKEMGNLPRSDINHVFEIDITNTGIA